MLSEDALSDEKMQSCRRRTRFPTRRCNHVVGGRAFRREDAIMSSEDALSDEKMQSCCRRTRFPTRRCNHVVGGRAFRREDAIMLSEDALSDEKMGSNKNVVSFIPEHWGGDQKFLAITGAVKTVGKPERISRRLFQAVVEIIKKKLPPATDF